MKNNYRNNFDSLLIREDYANKCDSLSDKYLQEYKKIVDITAKIEFDKFKQIFNGMSLDISDVNSLASMYALYFLNSYSFKNNADKLEKFKKKNPEKNQQQIDRYERNCLINFLKQKIRLAAKVCNRKSRNVSGFHHKSYIFAYTKDSIPNIDHELILKDHKKYGYRKVKNKEFMSVKKLAKNKKEIFDKDGFEIFKIYVLTKPIDTDDYFCFFNTDVNPYNSTPEEYSIHREETDRTERYKEVFNSMTVKKKKIILNKFIDRNKKNKYLKKELGLAVKLLNKNRKKQKKVVS